jgi:two-component system, NarL family, invasion response regulator UvrY
MIKLIIADDHERVRQAWVFILSRNPDIKIQAECKNGTEAILAVRKYCPDIVLMDINMEPMNGIEAARVISHTCNKTKVIGMSVHAEMAYVNKMLEVGAIGYVTKNSTCEEMMTAIKYALAGKTYLCTEIRELMRSNLQPH